VARILHDLGKRRKRATDGHLPATRALKRYKDLGALFFKYGRTSLAADGEEAAVAPASPETAEQLTADLEALGPTYVKLGQLLSTRADLLPPAFLEALTRLQDKVEPFSFEEVEAIVTAELGVKISKAFASFEEKPIAAASLGQVHRATMRDGREVAVKVQRPGIRETILKDLEALEEMAAFAEAHTELGKTLLNLDQVGRALDPTFDPNASIRRNAADLTRLRLRKSLSPANLLSGLMEVKEFAERLPGRINKILDTVASNGLQVKVDAIDEKLLIEASRRSPTASRWA
jgi:predicted unusual protein kinase regulating ubiquinone biosynthesis (AarF/ABC1/UbiB family)